MNLLLVARVPRELVAKDPLLFRYPPDEKRDGDQGRQDREPRSERDAATERDPDGPRVPGMPYVTVRPGGDHAMTAFRLDADHG